MLLQKSLPPKHKKASFPVAIIQAGDFSHRTYNTRKSK